jgi:hypothetical protein
VATQIIIALLGETLILRNLKKSGNIHIEFCESIQIQCGTKKIILMNEPILFKVPAQLLAFIMFILIWATNYLGFRYQKWQLRRHEKKESEGLGQMESSLMGLAALILAFTFGLAQSKFEAKRELIVQEANDIGTAILRCDLYPDSVRSLLRQDFKDYVEARVAYYETGADEAQIKAALKKAGMYSSRIWNRAADYGHDREHLIPTGQMIPALNNMIDITTTRDAQRLAKVPPFILLVLAILILTSSFLVGYGQKGKRNLVWVSAFAIMTTITLYLILELDRPKRGLINLDREEYKIVELRGMLE